MKMGSSDNITGVSYADIGDDNHDDLSFYSRRRMGNIVVLLITLTLHCFPMIISITLYFQDIYATHLIEQKPTLLASHVTTSAVLQYSSLFSLRCNCNITNVYPWVTAAVGSCKITHISCNGCRILAFLYYRGKIYMKLTFFCKSQEKYNSRIYAIPCAFPEIL